MSTFPKAAIIGGGVIGGGWAARFLLNGWNVAVFDPSPEAHATITEILTRARRSLPSLYNTALPPEGTLTFAATPEDAATGAAWVQESVPERLEIKYDVLSTLTKAAPREATIASSTSGFKPSELTAQGARAIVAHPFNPVYLLPLVELVGDVAECQRAAATLTGIGMYPLHVRHEIDAHIADRFLEAVWREALWLISDGIATTEEVDEAIRMGFGLRWAQMGLFETYRLAGGDAGMRHFMEQFGPALEWPWTKLMDVPPFTPELVELITAQSDAQSGDRSIDQLARERDDNLIGILRALRQSGKAAGRVIAAHEATLPKPEAADLPVTQSRPIPPTWTDYNGHMNEAHYLELGAAATDRFMEMIGADAAYISGGQSYFTAENHLCYLTELHEGDHVTVKTQVLEGQGKKLHLIHLIHDPKGALAATMETFLLHVDLTTRQTSLPAPQVAAKLADIAATHASLPHPAQAGRAIETR